MNKCAPEGSAAAFHSVLSNAYDCGLTLSQLTQKALDTPEDIDTRLVLVGKLLRRGTGQLLEHLLWLIDNHPRHSVHQFITFHKENSTYKEARRHWLRQVRSHPSDATIAYHAGIFLSVLSPKDAVRLLNRASDLDPLNDELPRQLAHVYSLMVGRYSAATNRSLAQKAAQQIKAAVQRYMAPNTQDSYLLPYFSKELRDFAELALTFELFDEARDIGELLLEHRSINLRRLAKPNVKNEKIYAVSKSLGHAVLGRAALGMGQADLAKQHLSLMMNLPVTRDSDWILADELLRLGETEIVSQYIEHFYNKLKDIQSTKSSLDEDSKTFVAQSQLVLGKWLNEIRNGKVPRLC